MNLRGSHTRVTERVLAVIHRQAGTITFALLVLWCAGLAVRLHGQLQRTARAVEAEEVLDSLRNRVFEANEAWQTAPNGTPPQGLLARLERRDDLEPLWARARDTLREDPEGRAALQGAEAELTALLDQARRTVLLQIEDRLTRHPNGAGALDSLIAASRDNLHRRLSEASMRLVRLEAIPQQTLRSTRRQAPLFGLLLLSVGLTIAFPAWRFRRARRDRDRHLEGARLVEEMLEAYSRRLEGMNAELEQVGLLKNQFLANTCHELLAPLDRITGALETLRDGSAASARDRDELLDQACGSAERLLALVRDLLDLCRAEEGGLALARRKIELGPILERVVAHNAPEMKTRGLTLLVTPPAQGWPRIQADHGRTEQVLQHLLGNALKFTERGSIRITGRIEDEGRVVRVDVSDTGPGIAPDRLPQVFDLFSRSDGSSARRLGGGGLGLTLCRHLIQGMDGEIGIESEGDGRGTRVWFTLPLAGSGEAAGPEPREAA